MCDGEYWIHLYKGDRAILTLGYHHGRSLRWHKGSWKGDGLLTARSRDALPAWFKKNGCPYLQSLCDEERARKRRESEEATRFASFFPEKVRGILLAHNGTIPINDSDDPAGKQIAEIIGDGKTTAIAVCRALGSCAVSWSMTSDKERRALAAVHTVQRQPFPGSPGATPQRPRGATGRGSCLLFGRIRQEAPGKGPGGMDCSLG